MSVLLIGVIITLSVCAHECGHGLAALHFGDPTARIAGRLTLNPLKHFDIWGGVVAPLLTWLIASIPFGWAKPLPVDTTCMTNKQYALVCLAGPATNVILAMLALPWLFIASKLALVVVLSNLSLAVFNLLPIPGFDGWQIIRAMRARS